MRRRDIISGVLTIIMLALTCNHWLIFKPMPVSFLVKGNGDYTFTVQLNKKDNEDFKKVKQCVIKKHLNGNIQKCECQIDRARFPKRFRIVVKSSNLSPIEIKDITLKNGKFKFPSVSEFKLASCATYGGGGGSLMPSANTFSLTYPEKLKVRSGIKFEALTFIIIAVLGYLLSYKLTSYLADFKVVGNYSRIDIIFLIICALFLFLPMSHISDAKLSDAENRNLAVWKPFINKKGQINYNFGRDYDNWFSDRFNLREYLVSFYNQFKYKIAFYYFENKQGFINKRNNWMSNTYWPSSGYYNNEELERIVYSINRLKQFCLKNNIKFYILIAPSKYDVYSANLFPLVAKSNEYARTMQVKEYVKNKINVDILYPIDEFKNAANGKELLFYKTDHHWTDEGAYLAYKCLMQYIKKDFPSIYVNDESDFSYFYSPKVRVEPERPFHNGFTANVLHLKDEKIFDTEYKYYKNKESENVSLKIDSNYPANYKLKHFKHDVAAPNLTLWGDSMGENLLQSIVYSFKNTERIYTWLPEISLAFKNLNIERFEKDILNNNTNVLVLCLSSAIRLKFLYKEGN